jgi:ubiquinone/menaquinone biosynthesis C-methylase UbiE
MHFEIFNPIEQTRLHNSLKMAIGYIKSPQEEKIALDYGCGSGNITSHLLSLGMRVVSADLSDDFLASIKKDFGDSGKTHILKINGYDLSGFADNSFDLVAVYSVLHHLPEYLAIIPEFIRVTKPGGVIYIDHERSQGSWNKDRLYREFLKQVRLNSFFDKRRFKKYFFLSNYLGFIRRLINPRYQPEGDIHVWPDDHIEWLKIEDIFSNQGCNIVFKENYLLYKNYPLKVYEAFKNKCHDYSLIIAAKKQRV